MKKSVLSLFIIASLMALTNVQKANAAWILVDECVNSKGDTWKTKRKPGIGRPTKLTKNGDFWKQAKVQEIEKLFEQKCAK